MVDIAQEAHFGSGIEDGGVEAAGVREGDRDPNPASVMEKPGSRKQIEA